MPSYDLIRHMDRDSQSYQEKYPVEVEMTEGLSSEDDPEALLNVELENHYRSAQEDWAEAAQKSEDFLHGIQYTEEQIEALQERGQSPVVMNVIWPAVEQAVAMMTTHRPRFQATAREDSDVKTASVVSDLMSWAWEQSHGNQALKNSIYDYYVKGRGVMHAYVDPDKDFGNGEICFVDEDPLDVFPDPNSQDRLWRDAAHVLVSKIMSREQIESMWPEASSLMHKASADYEYGGRNARYVATDGQQIKGEFYEGYHEKYRVITRYTKVKVPYERVSELFSGEEYIFLEDEFAEYLKQEAALIRSEDGQEQIVVGPELAQVLMMWEQDGIETEDPRVRTVVIPPPVDPETGEPLGQQQVVQIARLTYKDLVQMGAIEHHNYLEDRILQVMTIGGQLFYRGYLPISEYPLVPFNNRHNRTPYPMSDVQFVVPIQEQINKMQSLITANMASSTNVKAFIPRGTVDKDQVEQDFAKAGAAIIEYDPEMGVPVIAQPVPLPNSAFNQFQTLVAMVEREFGIYALMQGDPSNAPQTHKGTIAIEQFGQRRIRSKLDDIEESLNHLAKVFTGLMPHVYTERKVIRLKQPNNSVRESVANQFQYDDVGNVVGRAMDVTSGQYDMIMVSGSTLPSNRFALLDYYMELYGAGLIDQVEVLKKTDVVDAEGVLERFSAIQQMQQQLMMLSQEVERLQGDLQTREREVYHAKMALEVEKGKKSIGNTTNRMEMTSQLYEKRMADELAMQKREAKMKPSANGTS